MPKIIAGVSGVNREVKKIPVGVSGVNRECKEAWAGVGGVNRKVFSGDISSQIKICYFSEGLSTNKLQPIQSIVNNRIGDGVFINETTGDIYLQHSGSSTKGKALAFASVSTPLKIITFNSGLTSPPVESLWCAKKDGSGNGLEHYFRYYFNSIGETSIGGSGSGYEEVYNSPDLLGHVEWPNEYSLRKFEYKPINLIPNYELSTSFECASGISKTANVIRINGIRDDVSSDTFSQVKIPNNSIVINGEPIDFLKCVRSTT